MRLFFFVCVLVWRCFGVEPLMLFDFINIIIGANISKMLLLCLLLSLLSSSLLLFDICF